jgi:homoserine O-acetyltransferase
MAPDEPMTERLFDLPLAPLALEGGAVVRDHVVRGWWAGPPADLPALAARAALLPAAATPGAAGRVVRRSPAERAALAAERERSAAAPGGGAPDLDPAVPTVLVVHALTGDARAGGPGGWWEPVIGPGRALDTRRLRVLCCNNLGSCYGTSGPGDGDFPPRAADARFPAPRVEGRGAFALDEARLPATVTTWDQARSLLLALDRLGVGRVDLVTGGSLGGMILLCLAALAPQRFGALLPFGAAELATPWLLGWNHIGRQAVLLDPGWPDDVGRGLELARQIGHMSYRAEPGLAARQGRRLAPDAALVAAPPAVPPAWSSRTPYALQTYLEHQGRKLVARFDARAYLAQLDAMDHHDLARAPLPPAPGESWPATVPPPPGDGGAPAPRDPRVTPADPRASWGLVRVAAPTLAVGIDSDMLYLPRHMALLAARLAELGRRAAYAEIASPHGHDAFLIEWDQVGALLRRGLALAGAGTGAGAGVTTGSGAGAGAGTGER